jgi:chemotaxis signal transduction protein
MSMSNEMWVVVQLDTEPMAFPATLIKEVVPWQPLHPVPSNAVGVMGLVSLRGETLAVIDIQQMTGYGEITEPSFLLVLDLSETRVGLAVTRVEGVQYFDMNAADTNMAGGYIQGTIEKEDRLYQLISPAALEQVIAQHTDVTSLIDEF